MMATLPRRHWIEWLLLVSAVFLWCGCTTFGPQGEPFRYESIRTASNRASYEQERKRWEQQSRHLISKSNSGSSRGLLGGFSMPEFGKRKDVDKARSEYATAEQLYRQALQEPQEQRPAKFLEAAKHFVAAAKAWPDSSLEQDALFFAGESYFFADRYPQAAEQYGKLLKEHPNCRYLDVVQARRFAIAQYWLAVVENSQPGTTFVNLWDRSLPWFDSRGHALKLFDRIRIDDPTGKLADDATLAAANAYFRAGKYVMADQYYTDLRKTFPTSEHQFVAHLLGIQAKLRSYDGPDYSGTVLDEAEQLIKQIRRQFPAEYSKYREELEKTYAEIRAKQAEREWVMAQYYEKQQAYAAARFYYERVADQFAETAFAQAARERIDALAGLPDRPPQKLQWLVEQFPSSRQEKPLVATGAPPSVKR
jgi:outer membrane protein assembly factor BamD (BamD/ComL family)